MIVSIGFCYLQLIGIIYLVCILMGAPLLTDIVRTFFFSIYIVLIGFTPIIINLKGNLKDIYDCVFQNELFMSRKIFFIRNLVWGTMVGAWLGAIPIPLDWDRWWQEWPITCLISSTLGALCSIVISYFLLIFQKKIKN